MLIATPCFAQAVRTYTVCESGGGCDYTTLQAAETAIQQDLVANDSAITFEIQNAWTSPDGQTTFSGWTCDATRFFTVTAVGAARATATFSTTAWRAESAFDALLTNEDFAVFDGLQARLTTTDASARNGIGGNGLSNTIKNCFVKGSTGSAIDGISVIKSTTTGTVVRNNVVIDFPAVGINISSAATGGVKADNNTIENCGTGVSTSAEDGIIRNTIFLNVTTPISGSPNTTTLSEENWTDNASITYTGCGSCGTGDQLSQSDPFEDLAGENYLLASGSTPIDAGKDLSGDFTDAIGGKTRDANFDKGADEFIAAAPAGGNRVLIRKAMMFWPFWF